MKGSRFDLEPLISVIVPVYGAEKYLKKCVDSIISQLYEHIEIILVDDGSKDRGGAMCDEYAVLDKRVRVIHKENGGLMSAWIAGVNEASGDFLSFVDSDDWVEPEMLSELAANLIFGCKQIICCNYVIDRADGSSAFSKHGIIPGVYSGQNLREKIFDNILGNENRTISMSRCMKLISPELVRNNLNYCDTRIKLGEDVNIMLPAILDSERIVVLSSSYYYHYFYNDISMVHKYDDELEDNINILIQIISNVMHDKECNHADEQIKKEIQYLFMLQIKNEFRNICSRKIIADKIKKLSANHNIDKISKEFPISVSDKGNKLLYRIIKKPTIFNIYVALALFRIKNKKA